jgi:hypothetical protein
MILFGYIGLGASFGLVKVIDFRKKCNEKHVSFLRPTWTRASVQTSAPALAYGGARSTERKVSHQPFPACA